jgi:hypothetical protein
MNALSRLYCPAEDFTLRLRQRMPMNIGFSFTAEQMDALRRAFGERFDGQHAIDVRGRVYLPWTRYYLVVQAGRDRRTDLRRGVAGRATRTAIDSALCAASALGLLAGLGWLALRLL